MTLLDNRCRHTFERERALADNIKEVAGELRLIDLADLIAFIRFEQFSSLANLVNSSTELHFAPGTIFFGAAADLNSQWGAPSSVVLDMEFHHMRVSIYFRLLLDALHGGVEITYVSFDKLSDNPDENTQHMVNALSNARLQPRAVVEFSG